MGDGYFELDIPELIHFNYAEFDIKNFGLLLPKLGKSVDEDDNTNFGLYNVITSDWTEIKSDKSFGHCNKCQTYNILPTNTENSHSQMGEKSLEMVSKNNWFGICSV